MTRAYQRQVDAHTWWGSTHINLVAGHPYRFTASGTWYDTDIKCGPDGYTLDRIAPWKRPLFRLAGPFRPLDTGDRWYLLLGRIGVDGEPFEIGLGIPKRFDRSGELYCTVNDLRWMYFNNSGAVRLDVVDDSQ